MTVIGLASLAQPTDPIGDPWFSAMEALILLLALPMLGLMGSIHASALDILAWDGLFPLALLLAAPAFAGGGRNRTIRLLLRISAILALARLAGPITGDMR